MDSKDYKNKILKTFFTSEIPNRNLILKNTTEGESFDKFTSTATIGVKTALSDFNFGVSALIPCLVTYFNRNKEEILPELQKIAKEDYIRNIEDQATLLEEQAADLRTKLKSI